MDDIDRLLGPTRSEREALERLTTLLRNESPSYLERLLLRMTVLGSPPADGVELAYQWDVWREALQVLSGWYARNVKELLDAGAVNGEDAILSILLLNLHTEKQHEDHTVSDSAPDDGGRDAR